MPHAHSALLPVNVCTSALLTAFFCVLNLLPPVQDLKEFRKRVRLSRQSAQVGGAAGRCSPAAFLRE